MMSRYRFHCNRNWIASVKMSHRVIHWKIGEMDNGRDRNGKRLRNG